MDVEAIDLAAAALSFVDQIDLWKLATAGVDEPRTNEVPMDDVAIGDATIGAADSTSTTQEQ